MNIYSLMSPIFLWAVISAPIYAKAVDTEAEALASPQQLSDYFFAAARVGDIEVLSTFLDAGFPIDQANQKSYTALMVGAYAGQYSVTDLLLQRGANACLQDKRGNTAIMGALIKAEFRIVSLLYSYECDESLINKSGMSLEEFARYWGQADKLKELKDPA
ncbi:Ankyrin repeats (3 copies) [Shewanella psychrophila]|uniref:Ankyrin repeats (3 copies) n=1 Tax=Shewanella psychrophila TaxID=225848 RepID=A0A1S6HJ68_9GAMM|nr:ankyrin repeat domain-containing protein [Shewanella psychrophila]AQS35549.1 Ankyrin repeats (3 copies) [Shewanella psychrophila]